MIFVPKFIKKAIYEQAHLGKDENGTDNLMLKMFRDPPYDIKLQVWTFSVENPTDVLKNGSKPYLTEKGPYSFRVRLHKTDTAFLSNGTRFRFRNRRSFFFVPSRSCAECRLSDRVTVPNILFQKIVEITQKGPKWTPFIEMIVKGRENVFISVSVDELLFSGYQDPLISEICSNVLVKMMCKLANIPDRIGLFYGQNNTDDGQYAVDTGLNDPDLLGRVYSFKGIEGKLSDDHWYGERARMINGTDAELFGPNLMDAPKLQIFIGQLCRSFDLEVRQPAVTAGLPVFRYSQPDSALDIAVQRSQGFCNPNSPLFFNESVQPVGCAPSGLLDMSSCFPGSPPIFFSASHFRNAHAALRHSLAGNFSSPTDSNDLSFFDIEPIVGAVVGVQQRYQLNLGMQRGNLRMTKNMSNLVVPMVWLNESALIDSATRAQISRPVTALWGTFVVGIVFVCAGVVFLVTFVGVFIANKMTNRSCPNDSLNLIADPPTEGDPTEAQTLAAADQLTTDQ
ncbi:hypothetical protein niasHS_015026 [Heterodera schachtii]|uniref:Uncharacterized protein n=1 Tax=Heterodera schachtii TaxID=97005 RepID=A0ABD2I4J0_HETSC